MTHWAFTYEYGFLKRALVGDIIARLFGPPTATLVTVASVILVAAASAALLRLFVEPALRERSVGAWLFALAAATHSATIPNLVYDLGRFDHIGLLIALGSLLALARGTPTLRLVVVPLACVLGLLVHEGFFFLFVPLILAVWHYEEGGVRLGTRLAVAAGLCGLAWAIGSFGRMTALPMDAYVAHLEARQDFPIAASSVLVLYSDLRESAAHSFSMLFARWQLTNHAVLLLTLVPTLLLIRRLAGVVRGGQGTTTRARRIVFLAACSPLFLYALGVDVSRWWAMAVTNLFIAVAYLALRERATPTVADAVTKAPALLIAMLGISLIAGPLGVLHAYPLFDGLWAAAYGVSNRFWLVVDWLAPWT
jgi:hypothetical protein